MEISGQGNNLAGKNRQWKIGGKNSDPSRSMTIIFSTIIFM
jgi:hypothetical protein